MIALEVLEVRYHGTVAVLYARDEHGTETVVAAEPRMARDIASALRAGERPIIDAEPWQLLAPLARRQP